MNSENNLFEDQEIWGEPVNPLALLQEIQSMILRFISCSNETALTTALWIEMTWFIDFIDIAPLAVITAPEKRCGKTNLLALIGKLVKNPLVASNITAAALFRTIDSFHPTLLIDEADTFMNKNEELRGILNCGHTRDTAHIIRLVGKTFEPKIFSVWGAKAIAGIGILSDTLMDRSIRLELRRKLPDEKIDRFRDADQIIFSTLKAKLARLASDYGEEIMHATPILPKELNDRQQDNWEPLLALASFAGPEMLSMAYQAALRLSYTCHYDASPSIELLADIKSAFGDKDRICTEELIGNLCSNKERQWCTYERNSNITPRQINQLLKPYGISSKTVRIGLITRKGFLLDDFHDAFARYVLKEETT